MNDLSQHLAPAASHARLPFHGGCPLCRDERVLGANDDRPVSRKLGLGAAAAMLLLAPALPTIAAAADTPPAPASPAAGEPDSESEGTGQADPSGKGEDGPGSDMEGFNDHQVEENSPSLVAPGDNTRPEDGESEGGPLETAPPEDETDSPEQQSNAPGPPATPAPTGRAPASPKGTPAPTTEVPAQGPAGQEETSREKPSANAPNSKRPRAPSAKMRHSSPRPRDRRAESNGGGAGINAPTARESRSAVPLDPTSADRGSAAKTDDLDNAGNGRKGRGREGETASPTSNVQIHIVRPGESLWSIATAHLGGTPTPAEVAGEVERLWQRNANAIGTGDPDLLLVGQRLRMP